MDAVSSSANSAATYWNIIQKRTARQQDRITQGLSSGPITPDEKQSLDKSQAALDQLTATANADGSISGAEFSGLMQAMNGRSTQIYTDKHNDQAIDGITPDTGLTANAEDIIGKRTDALAGSLAQGVQSGQISPEQAQQVTDQQNNVDALLNQAKSDGSINSAEFTQIMHAQNQERHMIHRMRRNPYAQAAMQPAAQAATQGTAAGSAAAGVQTTASAQAVAPVNVTV